MIGNPSGLLFKIDGDASNLQKELKAVDASFTSLGSKLGSLGGAATVGVAGIAALGASVAAAGSALLGMTKSASDWGSVIHDASVKTGLGAESISALRLAADQSGTSLEQITGGVAKFAKTVGAAGEGSKEAAAKLKSLGIDPQAALNDLDGSLDKVFKRIGAAKPGIEQITLAQKAFGKSGADLIPLMEQVGYNFDAFKQRAHELGLTIDDEAARSADEFGDQMVELEAQLAAVGRTIGFELMPVVKDMATFTSDWLAQNKDDIRDWGTYTANILRGVAAYWRDVGQAMQESRAFGRSPFGGASAPDGFWSRFFLTGPLGMLAAEKGAAQDNLGGGWRSMTDKSDYFKKVTLPRDFDASGGGKVIKPPKETDDAFRKFFTDLGFSVNRTFGEALNKNSPHAYGGAADVSIRGKSISDIFTLMQAALQKGYRVVDERVPILGVKQTGPHLHFENAKTTLQKASIFSDKFAPGQAQYLTYLDQQRLGKASGMAGFEEYQQKQTDEEIEGLKNAWNEYLQFEQERAARSTAIRQNEANLAIEILQKQLREGIIDEVDYADRVGQLRIDQLEEEKAELEKMTPTKENIQKIEDKVLEIATARVKKENDVADAVERQNKAFLDQLDALDKLQKKNQRPGTLKKRDPDDNKSGSTTHNIWDLGKVQSAHDTVQNMRKNIKEMLNEAVNSEIDALGQAIAAWALYGESIGEAMKKATAAVLANLAAQAAVEAIWETAQGFAMLALGLFGHPGAFQSAAMHFASAAIYAGMAAGGALGARAIGGGGRGAGAGASGGGGQRPVDQTYSRVSQNAYNNGHRENNAVHGAVRELAGEVRSLRQKITGMRPGDVLARGAKEKPGLIGDHTVADVKRNSGTGRQLANAMGFNR